MPTNKKTIAFYPDNELREKLEKLSEKEGRSLANITYLIVKRMIDRYEEENGSLLAKSM